MNPDAKNKVKLSALLLMTILPVALATIYFRSVNGGGLGATSNHGTLIQPPADITALDMRDESGDAQFRRFEEMIAGIDADEYQTRPWLMIYVTANDCGQACLERISYLKALHTRLGKNAPRVRRYYLHASEAPISESNQQLFRESYPSMGIAFTSRQALEAGMSAAGADMNLDAENYVLLVDPVGNVMMYYTGQQTHEEIMEDLEHLLKYSSLG